MFQNSYSKLPERFYKRVKPSEVISPSLIKYNYELAEELGLANLSAEEILDYFSGNKIMPGSEPLAQVYAGHQFGTFVPRLGDGRAILLGEVLDKNGNRKDIQLKGAGLTNFSRTGDGRAWLGPVIREYIMSEAMHHLDIKTTRSLAAITTGESVFRETELPGAILTRVASSHIRVGTFEFFYARRDTEALKILADYSIERHYPEIKNDKNKYLSFLDKVQEAQAELISKWMNVSFIHGVMNTDNMAISGETLDYGPCAFMDFFNLDTVFSSIDRYGRYSYQSQPNICFWNLNCFANTLIPIVDNNEKKALTACKEVLNQFEKTFEKKYLGLALKKLGIIKRKKSDKDLLFSLFALMSKFRADFTLSFRLLAQIIESDNEQFFRLFDKPELSYPAIKQWLKDWRLRLKNQGLDYEKISKIMKKVNPVFIPRNHKVEEAIGKAHHEQDFSYMHKLVKVLKYPYKEQPGNEDYMLAPESKDLKYITFCGT